MGAHYQQDLGIDDADAEGTLRVVRRYSRSE